MARIYLGQYDPGSPQILEVYNRLFSEPPPFVALDVETVSLKDRTVLGIGIATPQRDCFYFDISDPTLPWHLILPSKTSKIWHNATFDLSWEALGKFGADIDNIEDTAIITRLLNMPTELQYAADSTTEETDSASSLLRKYKVKDMTGLPWEVTAKKCMQDVAVTMSLFLKYRSVVDDEYYKVDRDTISLLLKMSHRGILLDKELVNAIDTELAERDNYYTNVCKGLGFNPYSYQEVAYALSTQSIVLPMNRKKTHLATGKDILEGVSHPWAIMTLQARKHRRLYKVIHSMVGLDRVHSHFHMDAATGRITSKDIQLHNLPTGARPGDIIPKAGPIRRVLEADSSTFTRFDLSQVELRVIAYLSGDKYMNHILSLPKDQGGDIHIATMQALNLPSKVMAKNFNFGTLYGGDASVISKFTGIKDLGLIGRYQSIYARTFPECWAYIQQQRRQGLADMEVQTLYGRTLKLGQDADPEKQSSKHIMNCAVNYPIQGTAAEIFKRILLALKRDIATKDYVLQVHDEQLFDGIHNLPMEELANISKLRTPLEVSCLTRWQ